MSNPEDFVRRLREGDRQAAEEMVVELTPVLKRMVRAELRRLRAPQGRWWAAPSDIASEIWHRFFERRYQLRPWENIRHLTTFLHGVTKNVAREQVRRHLHCRKRDSRREMTLEQALLLDDAALLQIVTPFHEVVRLELSQRLVKCVPAGRQSILEMIFAGHDREQIAQLTGISLGTVRRIQERVRFESARAG